MKKSILPLAPSCQLYIRPYTWTIDHSEHGYVVAMGERTITTIVIYIDYSEDLFGRSIGKSLRVNIDVRLI